ncbi:MAG: hypothetical protein AAFN74_10465 [Myxococcota bacterium]
MHDDHCARVDQLDPIPYADAHSEDELGLFGPFQWLYPIRIEDREFYVPEDNTVLRALQYISLKSGAVRMRWHTFCWNNRDGCCAFKFRSGPGSPVREGRACATAIRPGLSIVQLPAGGTLCPPNR